MQYPPMAIPFTGTRTTERAAIPWAAHRRQWTPVSEPFHRKLSPSSARKAAPVPRLSLSVLRYSHRERLALSDGFVDMEHPIRLGGGRRQFIDCATSGLIAVTAGERALRACVCVWEHGSTA